MICWFNHQLLDWNHRPDDQYVLGKLCVFQTAVLLLSRPLQQGQHHMFYADLCCIDCKYPTFPEISCFCIFPTSFPLDFIIYISQYVSVISNHILSYLLIYCFSSHYLPIICPSHSVPIFSQSTAGFPSFDCSRVTPDLTRAIRPMCPLKRAPREKNMQICHPNWDFNQEKMSV